MYNVKMGSEDCGQFLKYILIYGFEMVDWNNSNPLV